MKMTSSGDVIWATSAGGPGADRAYSVEVDGAGNIYLTGYFYDAAEFDAITLTGADRDVFISKMDAAGNFIWAKKCGGPFGDTGYGIALDASSNVYITGQYKGLGSFGASSYSSMLNPSGVPSYDFFLSKLDNSGNFLWTQDGKAKFDDRGMSVCADELGNVYVGGQFSDTITFDATHNNAALNSGFLMKYNSSGNEMWFDQFKAFQTIVYDCKWNDGNVYVTGDFQSNLQLIHPGGTMIESSTYDYSVFVSKFEPTGIPDWISSNQSDNEITSKQLALDDDKDVYIAGMFKCDFTEMNEFYGASSFLSLGFRDVFVSKFSNSGNFEWSQQMGSVRDDFCSAIVTRFDDRPLVAGSFEDMIIIPGDDFFDNIGFLWYSGENCGDINYGTAIYESSNGQKDIFITDFAVVGRLPLDYYNQVGPCTHNAPEPQINPGTDTVEFCEIDQLYLALAHDEPPWGPSYTTLWNTGSTSNLIDVSVTGYYSVTTTREDACWVYYDSIYVIIHPNPTAPLITDSWGYNWLQPPLTTPIDTCYQDSLILTGTAGDTITDYLKWYLGGTYLGDTTIMVSSSGTYFLKATTEFGCVEWNAILVTLDDFAIHDTLDPHIVFDDSTLNATDTIQICEYDGIAAILIDSNFIHPSGGFPYKWSLWWLDGLFIDSIYYYPLPNLYITFWVDTGWHTLSCHLVNECGDSVDYYLSRDFYVTKVPNPYINILGPSGPQCPGDTVTLIAVTYADTVIWTGMNIINDYGDSVDVLVGTGSSSDFYDAYVDTTVGTTTCSYWDNFSFTVIPTPSISMVPSNGIICPGDSVKLIADSGIAWQWVSPTGADLGTASTQWVDLPGLYHCIVTMTSGCILTSNFVEVKEYSSPYLAVDETVICIDGIATVEVFGPDEMIITWLSPLSGSSPVMYLDTAGVYYCQTEFCGITNIDSITIFEVIVDSEISIFGDVELCPGDSTMLSGPSGMLEYSWNGDATIGPVLVTGDPGPYVLTVMDVSGCYGVSDTVWISLLTLPAPPVTSDTTICSGEGVVLTAIGTDSIFWYTLSEVLISSGPSLTLGAVTADTSFIVINMDSLCSSDSILVEVFVYESSVTPGLFGDSTYCVGELVTLWTDSTTAPSLVTWITPGGIFTGSTSILLAADSSAVGSYSVFLSDTACFSDTAEVLITVSDYPIVDLSIPDSAFCPGDSLIATATTDAGLLSWSTGDTTSSIAIYTPGIYYFTANESGCISYSDTVTTFWLPVTATPSPMDTIICPGDTAIFSVIGFESVWWLNSTLDTISTDSIFNTGPLFATNTYYLIVSDSGLCPSDLTYALVTVLPSDSAEYVGDLVGCPESWIEVFALSFDSSDVVWMDGSDTVATGLYFDYYFTTAGIYTYTLIIDNFCGYDSSDFTISIIDPPFSGLPPDTILCEGESLDVTSDYWYSFYWDIDSLTSDTIAVFAFVDTITGCYSIDTLVTYFIDCSLFAPNIFTPDGDGINDVIFFEVPKGDIIEFIVINRWGDKIYHSGDASWGGNTDTGLEAKAGTYFYVLRYTDFDDLEKQQYGHFYLAR